MRAPSGYLTMSPSTNAPTSIPERSMRLPPMEIVDGDVAHLAAVGIAGDHGAIDVAPLKLTLRTVTPSMPRPGACISR